MTYYQMPDGREAIHIGFNPEVGKEVYRVGDELIYTDKNGEVGGFPVVLKLEGKCLVLFHDGTWRAYTDEQVMEQETKEQDVAHIFWMGEESMGGGTKSTEEVEANAILIASAAELLKALNDLVDDYEQALYDELNRYPNELPIAVKARQILAKAEGTL